MIDYHALLPKVREIAINAGQAILDIYQRQQPIQVQKKSDNSPLTAADLKANEIIDTGLRQLTDLPIISEESVMPHYAIRENWPRCWLVDPLDGTREFIQGSGEFTVNIALIENHLPVLGVVYVPLSRECFFAAQGLGSFKQQARLAAQPIHVRDWQDKFIVLSSRQVEKREEWRAKLALLGEYEIKHLGSSLKFCRIAEGQADVYFRFGATSEWDSAAGQCIVEQAGGKVIDFSGKTLAYNKKSNLINPYFLVCGDPRLFVEILNFLEQEKIDGK